MAFNNSLIRAVHSFRLAFIALKRSTRITRQQIIFLSYLIENGHIGAFRVRQVMTPGLSWDLARQYLRSLQKIGYAEKNGQLWQVTVPGKMLYAEFIKEFKMRCEEPFRWR